MVLSLRQGSALPHFIHMTFLGSLLWNMMLLCVFILQHSAMKRLHLTERLQVNCLGEHLARETQEIHSIRAFVRTLGWPTLKGACMSDQQTSAYSSSSASGPQVHPCYGSWILTPGYQKDVIITNQSNLSLKAH